MRAETRNFWILVTAITLPLAAGMWGYKFSRGANMSGMRSHCSAPERGHHSCRRQPDHRREATVYYQFPQPAQSADAQAPADLPANCRPSCKR